MIKREDKHRILILGASGFLGGSLYKELYPYFRTFGTYHKENTTFSKNKHFFQYNLEEDSYPIAKLSGLISLCIIKLSCKYFNPSTICLK